MVQHFDGFTAQSLEFLVDVRQNNSKDWFTQQKHQYQQLLLEPMRALVNSLAPRMLMIDDHFETRAAVGKTISRIHRDTRFSSDKSLYRSSIWLTFKRVSKDWKDGPAYFFEFTPHMYRYGLGYYSASRQTMDQFRRLIDSDHQHFLKIASCCQPPFEIHGDLYKRPLAKDLPDNIAQWYNRKSFAVMIINPDVEGLYSAKLLSQIEHHFAQLEPLYHYLINVERMKRQPQ